MPRPERPPITSPSLQRISSLLFARRAADRDEAQRHERPLVNGSDRGPPSSLDLGDLDTVDNLEGAQVGWGEVSLQDNSSVPVGHSREFDQEPGSDDEMGGQ